MQGGGACIDSGGSANFTSCNVYGNFGKDNVRARIFELLEPSSSSPLKSDDLALFTRRARLVLAFEPSGAFFQRPAGTLRG